MIKAHVSPSSDVVPGLHADQGFVEQRPGGQGPALQTELLRLPAQHQHPHGQQERSVLIRLMNQNAGATFKMSKWRNLF